jgi:large-conductance mechanosensitive channel
MILLLRFILVGLIIYLLVRSFAGYFREEGESRVVPEDKKHPDTKKISKNIGEYVDYEETDKK